MGAMSDSAAGDKTVLDHIHDLVSEEKALRSAHSGVGMTETGRQRLKDLQGELDQAWDLLRQREGLRDAGKNPDEAKERPEGEVEGYLQ